MATALGLGIPAISGVRSAAAAGNPNVNACGCYRDVSGACFCGKKSKCECPGDCEPKGCDEKRAKAMEREVEAEVKRAREAEKKQREAEAARKKKAETVDDSEEAAAAARLEAAQAEGVADEGTTTGEGKGKLGKVSKVGQAGKSGKPDRKGNDVKTAKDPDTTSSDSAAK
jgi:hypothetical protein